MQAAISCIASARYCGKCLWRETGYLEVTVWKKRQKQTDRQTN